jgi:hypothetical protein
VLFFLSAPSPQALNLDKWVGLALGVTCPSHSSCPQACCSDPQPVHRGWGFPPPQLSGPVAQNRLGRQEGRVGASEPPFPPTCSFLLFPILFPNLDFSFLPHGTSSLTSFHSKCGSLLVQEWVCHVIMWPHHMVPLERGHVRAMMETWYHQALGCNFLTKGLSLLVLTRGCVAAQGGHLATVGDSHMFINCKDCPSAYRLQLSCVTTK